MAPNSRGLLYRRRDLNPYGHFCPLDFKSSVSTNSTTSATVIKKAERVRLCRAKNGIRTRDLHLGKVALYQLSYFRVLLVNIPSFEGGSKFKIFRINTKGIYRKNKGLAPIFLLFVRGPHQKLFDVIQSHKRRHWGQIVHIGVENFLFDSLQ